MSVIFDLTLIFVICVSVFMFIVFKFSEFKIKNQWIKTSLGITVLAIILSGVGLIINEVDFKKELEKDLESQFNFYSQVIRPSWDLQLNSLNNEKLLDKE